MCSILESILKSKSYKKLKTYYLLCFAAQELVFHLKMMKKYVFFHIMIKTFHDQRCEFNWAEVFWPEGLADIACQIFYENLKTNTIVRSCLQPSCVGGITKCNKSHFCNLESMYSCMYVRA